ncbi:hypothetical protein [Bogoriella caseilytica]|uniref:Uncharacterized protein n=1 Tax=Bogoriella caseilytica TaxID=56055 RepID=A0A3N2BFD6_9MICO|nr:hypothetical protein [Bogoriella caseilytica]ROR73966.1 hypothetical protein EDD31_2361 [Bogoriella caseilytica]
MNAQQQDSWDKLAAAVVQPDSPAYGDERERAILTEAATLAMQVGSYLCFAGALLTALFGNILAPAVLILAGTVPSYSMMWYASRRGVDAHALAARAPMRSIGGAMALVTLSLVGSAAAIAFTIWQGEGILPGLPFADIGLSPYVGVGMAVGTVLGLTLAILGLAKDRRSARERDSAEAPDEE